MELLNGAKLSTDAAAKSTHLKQLAELVIRKDPSLLGEFLEPLLELQVDPAVAGCPGTAAPCVGATPLAAACWVAVGSLLKVSMLTVTLANASATFRSV